MNYFNLSPRKYFWWNNYGYIVIIDILIETYFNSTRKFYHFPAFCCGTLAFLTKLCDLLTEEFCFLFFNCEHSKSERSLSTSSASLLLEPAAGLPCGALLFPLLGAIFLLPEAVACTGIIFPYLDLLPDIFNIFHVFGAKLWNADAILFWHKVLGSVTIFMYRSQNFEIPLLRFSSCKATLSRMPLNTNLTFSLRVFSSVSQLFTFVGIWLKHVFS